MDKKTLIAKLPPEKGKVKVIAKWQDLDDITAEVVRAHQVFAPDYDRICGDFAGPSIEKRLYDSCQKLFRYDIETEWNQNTKSPTVLLLDGHCDCKGYAGFIAGILDGLNRKGHGKYDWCYRFAEYDEVKTDAFTSESKVVTHYHVFVVVRRPDGGEIWIDPVLSQFNKRSPYPDRWIDKEVCTMLTRLSGAPGRPAGQPSGAGCCAGPLTAYGGRKKVGAPLVPSFTAAQQGIPILQAVFNWRNEYPGAAAAIASSPPVRFFDGNNQIALPPPVTVAGQAVPPLPANIRLVWDSSFMGKPIPPDMINVANENGGLVLYPTIISSVGGTAAATYNYVHNTNRYLLFLLIGAIENLINSYSSYPWGGQWQDLANQIQAVLNGGLWVPVNYNFLIYPNAGQRTFAGQILQGTAQAVKVALPVLSVAANFVIPGSGIAVAAAGGALTAAELNSKGPNAQTNVINQNAGELIAPGGGVQLTNLADTVSSFAQQNPIMTLGLAALAALLITEMFKD
jgi:hypothetical protein